MAQKFTEQEEILTMSQDERHPADPVQFAERGQLNSGIVVFSSTRKALYVNEAAQELLMRLNRKENEHSTNGVIPKSVDNLLDEMLPLLRTAGMNQGWKQLDPRRLVAAPDQLVLIKAFGIPDRLDIQRSLIVLLIERISHPVES